MSKTGTCTAPRGLAHRLLVHVFPFFPSLNARHTAFMWVEGTLWRVPDPSSRPSFYPRSAGTHTLVSLDRLPPVAELNPTICPPAPLRQVLSTHSPPPHMSPTHTKDLTRWCPPSGPPAVYPLLIHPPCLRPPRSANLSPLGLLLRLPQNGERERASFRGAHCIQVRTSQCLP